jgi:hypothetical protein
MLLEPRLKLEEAELLLKPPPLLNVLLLRGLDDIDRLLETRSPPPLGLLVVDGRLFDGWVLGRLADVRSPPGRFIEERSPPGPFACDRSPSGRLAGWVRAVPPYFCAVDRFE